MKFRTIRRGFAGGLLLFGLGGLAVGCATIDDLSSVTYRRVLLPPETFKESPMAVLPMVGRGGVRGHLHAADAIFLESLQREGQRRIWVEPGESLERIRKAGLESVYDEWSRGYTAAGPPRARPLRALGQAIGSRYLLLTELERIELAEGATQVRIAGRIWDADQGEPLWEGVGEGRGYVFLLFPRVPSSFEKTMAVAANGLVRRLP